MKTTAPATNVFAPQLRETHTPPARKHSSKRRTVKLTLWMKPLVKAEIQRIAGQDHLSLSKVGAAGLEEWVHWKIHRQQEALLYPVIRQVIREELRTFGDRLVFFLMRIAVAIESAKILIANVLDRLLFGKAEEYTQLLERSDLLARQKVRDKIPHIKHLVQTWNGAGGETGKEETKRAV